MFGIYFGKYLMEEGILSKEQYLEVMERTKNSKVQMGLLAVEMGLMTEEQTYEVNQMQQMKDKRFGDIAIEQGYLTEDDVADILDRQGDPYLLFIQALVEGDYLDIDEIREEMVVYRKAKGLSFDDLEALKTGDVDRITPIFLQEKSLPWTFMDYIMLTSRNIVRFVDRFFRMDKVERVNEVTAPNLALQHISKGASFYTIFSGTDASISALANGFARTAFDVADQVSCTLDATKEFLNCNNGLFLTELSKRHKTRAKFDLEVPITKDKQVIITADSMYRVPYYIDDKELNLVLCEDDNFRIWE